MAFAVRLCPIMPIRLRGHRPEKIAAGRLLPLADPILLTRRRLRQCQCGRSRFARSRQSTVGRSDGLNEGDAQHSGHAPLIALDVLDGHLGYFVRRIQVWVFHDFIRTLKRIDVSPAQFSVLVVISANRGCRSPSWRQRSALNGRGLRGYCTGWRRGASFSACNRPPTAAATRCNSCRPAARCSHAPRRWRRITSAN
jgi:hypothetical protein